MQVSKLTGVAEASNITYLRRNVLMYLNGHENWKFVIAIIRQSGCGKREALDALTPLKGEGWKSRSDALFAWLEMPDSRF